MTSVSRQLAYFLLISRFIAVFLSSYSIIFGKSYVSPGYKSSDRENTGVILGRWSGRIIITVRRQNLVDLKLPELRET